MLLLLFRLITTPSQALFLDRIAEVKVYGNQYNLRYELKAYIQAVISQNGVRQKRFSELIAFSSYSYCLQVLFCTQGTVFSSSCLAYFYLSLRYIDATIRRHSALFFFSSSPRFFKEFYFDFVFHWVRCSVLF